MVIGVVGREIELSDHVTSDIEVALKKNNQQVLCC